MLLSFATKARIYPQGTHKHQGNSFLNLWTDQIEIFPRKCMSSTCSNSKKLDGDTDVHIILNLFNLNDSSLGRHVNAASRKSLEISRVRYSVTKSRTLSRLLVSIFWWRHVKTNNELTYIRNYWLVYVTLFLKKKTPIVSSLKFYWFQKVLFGKLRMFSLFI